MENITESMVFIYKTEILNDLEAKKTWLDAIKEFESFTAYIDILVEKK